jgi:hypothetical protein
MAKPVARDVVESDLDNQLRPKRLPFAAAFRAPAAGPTRRLSRETWRSLKCAKLAGQGRPLIIGDRRGPRGPARCKGLAAGSPPQAGCSDIESLQPRNRRSASA